MKRNGITLDNQGRNIVIMPDGSEVRRTVYSVPNQWEFYIRVDGEYMQVYHGSYYYTTRKTDKGQK